LLTQQPLIIINRLPIKEINFQFVFPFTANKRKVAVSVFHLRKQYRSYNFLFVPFSVYIYIYIYVCCKRKTERGNFHLFTVNVIGKQMYIYTEKGTIYTYDAISNGKSKKEAQVIFLNLFSVCSLCIRKFVFCPFFYEETKEVICLQTD
jgi:hypothetical protein